MDSPEERARVNIDRLLTAAGWQVQDRRRTNLGAAVGVAVREFPLTTGEADYLLFVNRKAIGGVEAKPEGATLSGVEVQSGKYSVGLPERVPAWHRPLPFLYESTGVETFFSNGLDPQPRSRRVFAFHRPETLAEWAGDGRGDPLRLPTWGDREAARVRPYSVWMCHVHPTRHHRPTPLELLQRPARRRRTACALKDVHTGVGNMTYDPERHRRWSIRLSGYDYSQSGAYFVTLCTQGRECVMEDPIVSGIITDVWHALPRWFPNIDLDEFVIMPNHNHLIMWIYPAGTYVDAGADWAGAIVVVPDAVAPDASGRTWVIPEPTAVNLAPTLGDVIGAFKSLVFTVYLDWVQVNDPTRRAKFWQRNYYEHIIRSETELYAIRRYIRENPLRWALDPDNPQNLPRHPLPAKVEEYLADVKRHDNHR